MSSSSRKTSQFLMPAVKPEAEQGKYDIYPTYEIGEGKIFRGLDTLAKKIASEKTVIIDGFCGIFFDQLRNELDVLFKTRYKVKVEWISTLDFFRSEAEIDKMIRPFLGGDDPLFGTRTNLSLADFFDPVQLNSSLQFEESIHYIIYGIGAGLFHQNGLLIYFDLPKNELQFRARAGRVTNLGTSVPCDPKSMYKRFYFIDWVVLGKHKHDILNKIDILADGQRTGDITWSKGADFRESLHEMSRNVFRARPWFEPGTWGGSWIKDNIQGVNPEVPNYAWSFELITPENGLIIESSGIMLEFSFDFLMFQEADVLLGDCFKRFGSEFPIRFDFLDTIDGGNLSIQCHPRPDYMKENFGEGFTQEETYYILDTKDFADVYLGFQEDIDKQKFRTNLQNSYQNNEPVNIEEFVQKHSSKKHDFFLIPYGTIHGSGKNNLVLEISTTPYIFTFKMYDWLRPDLDGKPRPLNIERGMQNLFFDRKGKNVPEEFISKPVLLDEGNDWQLFHLPTHPTHLYDVIRYHFKNEIKIANGNKLHVLNLVEGICIRVEIPGSIAKVFSFAETFIIPASIPDYKVVNRSEDTAILIIAFVK